MYNIKPYSIFTESINERTRVTKELWNDMEYQEREELLLTVFKDPDEALKYVETEWDYLPEVAKANMLIIEETASVNEEDVNTDIVEAKLKITELREDIALEVSKQKDADSLEDKAKSIDMQANLHQRMPALLRTLATAIKAKAAAGDSSNIY